MEQQSSEVTIRHPDGRFISGHNGGRPKGSRNKLGEAMIDDLYRHWLDHGIQAIERVFELSPVDYVKIVAMLVSKCEDVGERAAKFADLEAFIEERRQKALVQIAEMSNEG